MKDLLDFHELDNIELLKVLINFLKLKDYKSNESFGLELIDLEEDKELSEEELNFVIKRIVEEINNRKVYK